MKGIEMSKKLESLVSKTPSKWIEESNKRFEERDIRIKKMIEDYKALNPEL